MTLIISRITISQINQQKEVFRQSDGLQLPEGGDFGAIHGQLSTNVDRSTKLELTTEPPLLGRCCYAQLFFHYFAALQYLSFVIRKCQKVNTCRLV